MIIHSFSLSVTPRLVIDTLEPIPLMHDPLPLRQHIPPGQKCPSERGGLCRPQGTGVQPPQAEPELALSVGVHHVGCACRMRSFSGVSHTFDALYLSNRSDKESSSMAGTRSSRHNPHWTDTARHPQGLRIRNVPLQL